MDEMLQNNEDKNQNGIPDWMEDREDDAEFIPQGNAFDNAYTSEESIAKNIPDYKDYKWYHSPSENYFYSKGERLENAIESGEITPDELPENSAIQKEAEQLTDDNPNNDEVNNEAIKEISQKEFDEIPIDDLEKSDGVAMKGDAPYLQVAQDLGFDEDDFLYYFEQAGYKPEEVENLTEEQKDEIRKIENKDDKFAKLKDFISSLGGKVNTELQPEENKIELEENTPISSGPRTAGFSFLGSSGGSVSAPSVKSVNAEIDSNNASNNGNTTNGDTPEVAEMDGNIASTNGANKVEHLDDSMDSLGFKETKHEKDIKSNEQADLPGGETWTENNDHWELPDIKKMMTKRGGGIYLPFKFTIENGELYISQIGTGRKLPFDEFLKVEPTAGKQLIEVMNGDK